VLGNGESRVDLHVHSDRSDGRSAPADVVSTAKEKGLKVVALTDHDTVAGLAEARAAAESLDVVLVPGIEFSCYDDAGSTHLLGYFIDPTQAGLAEYLEGLREKRLSRAAAMVDKLNRLGVDVTLEAVVGQASPEGLIARPHVARALVDGGWVKSYVEAFNRFLAAGQPAYVPTWRMTPTDGIRWIHDAKGLAVLAHAGKSHSDATIMLLVNDGLDGLEVLHPEHGTFEIDRLRRIAADHGLLETGGSDWHGPHDGRRGQLASQPVPYEWYLRLKEAADAAKR
jgi:predicted metal-dependent phosphoesterase TrpH